MSRSSCTVILMLTTILLFPVFGELNGQEAPTDPNRDRTTIDLSVEREVWNQLSAEKKRRCLATYQRIQKMDPRVRARLLNRLRKLTDEQRGKLPQIVSRFKGEKPADRQRARKAFRQRELWLKTQSPEDRRQLTQSSKMMRKRHFEDRIKRSRERLLKRVSPQLLDPEKKERILALRHEEFRKELSKMALSDIRLQVSDRTMQLINDLEALDPPLMREFLTRGQLPSEHADFLKRFQELDPEEQKDLRRFLGKIGRNLRMRRAPEERRFQGPPGERGGRGGRGSDLKRGNEDNPRLGNPDRRSPDRRPRGPKSPPKAPLEGSGSAWEIHDNQA